MEMETDVRTQTGIKEGIIEGITGKSQLVVPFRRSDLKSALFSSSKVERKRFINIINFHNFVNEQVFAQMVYPLTKEEFLFKVLPGPCIGDELTCTLPEGTHLSFDNFIFKGLIIDDGKSIMVMHADPIQLSSRSLIVRLRKSGTIYNLRQAKRFYCHMVDAVLQKKEIKIEGSLEEFNPSGMRISLKEKLSEVSPFLSPSEDFSIQLTRGGKLIFSGLGNFIRMEDRNNAIVVKPRYIPQKIYKEKKFRNPRMNFSPSPKVIFDHPLTLKRVTFDVVDITTSGFSVVADSETSLLMPGMIIGDVTIARSGLFSMKFSAHVVYASPEKKNKIRYGFAIYDTDVVTYNHLFDMYCNSIDRHANVSRDVNMDLLWEFFFESGFIYPKKYLCFSQYKEDYKKTYEKLYHNSPEIFANFTYQENDAIYGHVSIIKSYERTWMIHHLAAKPMGTKRTGLFVLNHILNYFDGFYRMPSIGMDYMIFYFQPENRFPNHFFGGFCRQLNNPQGCSMDCFAYLTQTIPPKETILPDGWILSECSTHDIIELRSSYKHISGGLMIDSFCLDREKSTEKSIEALYGKYGLKRRYGAHVLKHGGKAKAYMLVDESDMGINLSELLNSVKIIVTDSTGLPWDILDTSLGKFAELYGTQNVPVLVYPYQYLDNQGISYSKKYNLWVLSARSGDDYTEHLKKQAKIRPAKLLLKILLAKILNK
jgi:hypothetical protein